MLMTIPTADHPTDQQARAKGDGAGVQDGQGRRHWLQEQRLGGLRVQDVRSHPGQARQRQRRVSPQHQVRVSPVEVEPVMSRGDQSCVPRRWCYFVVVG